MSDSKRQTARITPVIDVHLDPEWILPAMRSDVANGLTSVPKELPPKWFYDDRGSQLFDQITRLVEYYPFRTERAILAHDAATIAATAGAETLVELGSGTSEKTRLLLDAMRDTGSLTTYVPFDVSEATLRTAADELADEYEGLRIHGVVGDFEHHLPAIPKGGRRLFAFLGGTIGNLSPEPRASFLRDLSSVMEPGDRFLLGTDLVKDPQRLVAAYDDAAGVTAAFNKNVLQVINTTLNADFDLDAFTHRAHYDEEENWIEMLLVSDRDQRVSIIDLDLEIDFVAGESMRTEISAKFRTETVDAELRVAGLVPEAWFSDQDEDFLLCLSTRPFLSN